MSLDWRELRKLSPGALQNALLDELHTAMPAESEDQDQRLAALAPPLRVLWLLDWLDFEVAQGGLLAYLTNSHGRHASLAAEALRDIGAPTMAAVLDTARSTVTAAAVGAPSPHNTATAEHPRAKTDELPYTTALIELTDRYELVPRHAALNG